MCKKFLRLAQKPDEELVAEARGWAKDLTRRETRGPGDLDNAMRRVAGRIGVPYGALWSLRYRPPKGVLASIYFALRDAFEAERARQFQALKNDLETTERTAGPDRYLVLAARAVVDAADGGAAQGCPASTAMSWRRSRRPIRSTR